MIEQALSKKMDVKPFIKWAGGKTQLLPIFNSKYPMELKMGEIKNYYEPFLGGGAVFFDIVSKYDIKNIYLFDINEELILVYKVVQKDVEKLIEVLSLLKRQYLEMTQEEREIFFYTIREDYNKTKHLVNHQKYSGKWIHRAAQMIFLNKTCFNGLYRLNRKGEFNVPFGDCKNPKFIDEENFINVSRVLANANIKIGHFENIVADIKDSSFVYFDPPYRPISKTSNFNTYSKNEFNDELQKMLAHTFRKLDEFNVKLMLSNSDPKNTDCQDSFFDNLYKGFNIERILATRMINSKGKKRGKIFEILIMNYKDE